MTKNEFVFQLLDKLAGLPEDVVEESVKFYLESIEDRMEDGLSEEDAVSAVGSIDSIAQQIMADIPISKLAIQKLKTKRKYKAGEIVLLVLGAPLWLSLLIASFAVILSVYISIWAVVVSLWAVFASVAVCVLAGILLGVVFCVEGNAIAATAYFGMGIVCAGLSILFFMGCKLATKGVVWLTKKAGSCVKKCFVKKEKML